MSWHEAVEKMEPSVVKIETPRGHGTGFICDIIEDGTIVGIATAAHVVREADKWETPLRIITNREVLRSGPGDVALIKPEYREILFSKDQDSAIVFFDNSKFETALPEQVVPIDVSPGYLKTGVKVGWIGFPGNIGIERHFFSGEISAFDEDKRVYYIDGAVDKGVSGGPVFLEFGERLSIIGIISHYSYSKELFTGLSIAQNTQELEYLRKEFKKLRKEFN